MSDNFILLRIREFDLVDLASGKMTVSFSKEKVNPNAKQVLFYYDYHTNIICKADIIDITTGTPDELWKLFSNQIIINAKNKRTPVKKSYDRMFQSNHTITAIRFKIPNPIHLI